MDIKKIEEAKVNFDSYLNNDLLKKVDFDENIFNKFQQNSVESLEVANELFNNKTSSLWVVVSSYYAMFYIASAYIYKKGYKTEHKIVHKIISDALIVLAKKDLTTKILEDFETERENALSIAENLIDSLEYERAKRSRFQYEMTEQIKESKANTSLNRAKEFVSIFRKLIQVIKNE